MQEITSASACPLPSPERLGREYFMVYSVIITKKGTSPTALARNLLYRIVRRIPNAVQGISRAEMPAGKYPRPFAAEGSRTPRREAVRCSESRSERLGTIPGGAGKLSYPFAVTT
jgi:hypothetical protein